MSDARRVENHDDLTPYLRDALAPILDDCFARLEAASSETDVAVITEAVWLAASAGAHQATASFQFAAERFPGAEIRAGGHHLHRERDDEDE